MNELLDRMPVAVSNGLRGAGETPHPYLLDGIDVALASVISASVPSEGGPSLQELLERFEDPDAVFAAVEQVVRFMQQFKSPEAMFDSLGLPAPDTEEQDALPTDSGN